MTVHGTGRMKVVIPDGSLHSHIALVESIRLGVIEDIVEYIVGGEYRHCGVSVLRSKRRCAVQERGIPVLVYFPWFLFAL